MQCKLEVTWTIVRCRDREKERPLCNHYFSALERSLVHVKLLTRHKVTFENSSRVIYNVPHEHQSPKCGEDNLIWPKVKYESWQWTQCYKKQSRKTYVAEDVEIIPGSTERWEVNDLIEMAGRIFTLGLAAERRDSNKSSRLQFVR